MHRSPGRCSSTWTRISSSVRSSRSSCASTWRTRRRWSARSGTCPLQPSSISRTSDGFRRTVALSNAPVAPVAAAGRRGSPTPGAAGLVARHRRERWIGALLVLCRAMSILTTPGIVVVRIVESLAFFREVSPLTFLTGTEWSPQFISRQYGVLPLVTGSVVVAFIAAAVALPIGLLAAIYLSEYAHERARRILKPTLEVLAGVPT